MKYYDVYHRSYLPKKLKMDRHQQEKIEQVQIK